MTRAEVEQRLQEFLALVDRQQAIREELLRLKMWGQRATTQDVEDLVARHQALIDELEAIRTSQMLPILEGLAQFLCAARAPKPRGGGSWQTARTLLSSTG